jgi:S1-C subfamily serine protease
MTPADKMVLANGQGEGSGFHFIKPGIIVSNAHVVGQLISG